MNIKKFIYIASAVAVGVFVCDLAETGVNYIQDKCKEYKRFRDGVEKNTDNDVDMMDANAGFEVVRGKRSVGFASIVKGENDG